MVSLQQGEERKVSRVLEGKLAIVTGASRGMKSSRIVWRAKI
jgi:hypothetical protein